MCLIIDKELTELAKNNKEEFVIRYKFIIKDGDLYKSYFWVYKWQLGCNIAKGILSLVGAVHDGAFHVFLTQKDTEHFLNISPPIKTIPPDEVIIIKVKCYLKDLIAVGQYDCEAYKYLTEAYTQVYVEDFTAVPYELWSWTLTEEPAWHSHPN